MEIDLLKYVEYGGCSAKLSPVQLNEILNRLPVTSHQNLLVGIETHDDAGVYKFNDETALIFTTDFFPPVCSDPYEFGQIAAANALSDIYAMGGKPLMALNIVSFSSSKLPIEVYTEILRGGYEKVQEAGCLLVGGHTIDDHPPKYGLAVIGTVHPDKLITNALANTGDKLILTKPLGIGALVAGKREQIVSEASYNTAKKMMQYLNKQGAEIMQKHGARCATDITGFGLLGHAYKLSTASHVSMHIESNKIPFLPEALDTYRAGCIPGAAFRNLEYVEKNCHFSNHVDYEYKMLCCDPQTSGGLLICVGRKKAKKLLNDLKDIPLMKEAAIIGEVIEDSPRKIYVD